MRKRFGDSFPEDFPGFGSCRILRLAADSHAANRYTRALWTAGIFAFCEAF